jgi:dihydropteroate synthase
MKRYVEHIIVPYIEHVRDEFDLPLKQKALCIFDVYKAHQDKSLLSFMEEKGIKVVFVPASCTDCLQPLHIQINDRFKSLLKSEFQMHYANEIKSSLEKGVDIENVEVDMRLSKIKPIHAKWLVKATDQISEDTELITRAFEKAGI